MITRHRWVAGTAALVITWRVVRREPWGARRAGARVGRWGGRWVDPMAAPAGRLITTMTRGRGGRELSLVGFM